MKTTFQNSVFFETGELRMKQRINNVRTLGSKRDDLNGSMGTDFSEFIAAILLNLVC